MGRSKRVTLAIALAVIGALSGCTQLAAPNVTAKAPAAEPPAPKPEPPAPPPRLILADLARYAPADIQSVIGAPSLERMEGTMQVLQFTSGTCITDLIFENGAQLIHVEARAKTGIPIEIQPCLDSFSQETSAIKQPISQMPTS